jgi:hypothetical protein
MALYVSARRRRTRAVIAAAVAGLLAFGIGVLVGRQQVPSVSERIAAVQRDAGDVATGLERLDVEYAKVLAGTDSLDEAVLAPIDQAIGRAQHALDEAPWITAAQRAAIVDALAQTRQSAVAEDPQDTFVGHLHDAAALVRSTFGVSA